MKCNIWGHVLAQNEEKHEFCNKKNTESCSTQGEGRVLLGDREQIYLSSLGMFSLPCPIHSFLQSSEKATQELHTFW
jgi:hypothetical protein